MRLSNLLLTLNENININIKEVNGSFSFEGTCCQLKAFLNSLECECWDILAINGWTDAEYEKGFYLHISIERAKSIT